MMMRRLVSLASILVVLLASVNVAEAKGFKIKTGGAYDLHSTKTDVEPFVFVETDPGAGTVRRATKADSGDLELFGVAAAEASLVLADPFNPNQTFAKGVDLGIELANWRLTQGAVKLNCRVKEDGTSKASLSNKFRNLVSKGRYSLWSVDGTALDNFSNPEPVGNPGADDPSFKASRSGKGALGAKLDVCPSSFTGEALKLLLFYQFDPNASIATPAPGVNGAYQLFRVLK